jgi:uncharacterized protein (UPF0335 family)
MTKTPGPGHNSKPTAADFAKRIGALLDDRDAIDADVKEIYVEVKAAGLSPKLLRKAIAVSRKGTAAWKAENEAVEELIDIFG